MENHPIPQDVTGFQFKLIGDMTIKQFAYVCAGIIVGWIFFSAHLPAFIGLPVGIFFALLGFILAFVPMEGRPIDQMIARYAKALFVPNQYVYEKTGDDSPNASVSATASIPGASIRPLDFSKTQSPKASPTSTLHIHASAATQASSSIPIAAPLPIQQVQQSPVSQALLEEQKTYQMGKSNGSSSGEQEIRDELEKEKEELEKELSEVQKLKESQKQNTVTPIDVTNKLSDLEKKLEETLINKKKLEEELVQLRRSVETQKQPVFSPIEKTIPKTDYVKKIPQALGKASGITIMPDAPNVIIGIVKDPRGNVLPNILVEVTDAEGNSARAFKTNAVGQFASATPLKNGIYTISFEDPAGANSFDRVQLTAQGQILEPIEIISHDQREELAKALFAGGVN